MVTAAYVQPISFDACDEPELEPDQPTDRPEARPPEDLTVQVRVDSTAWHRRCVGGSFTACGKSLMRPQVGSLRHEEYSGELCTEGCFTAFELELSRRANEKLEQDPGAHLSWDWTKKEKP